MRGKNSAERSIPSAIESGNFGIGNSFDEIAESLIRNSNFTSLLAVSNFNGSITIHVEPQRNSIRHIQFNYDYRVKKEC